MTYGENLTAPINNPPSNQRFQGDEPVHDIHEIAEVKLREMLGRPRYYYEHCIARHIDNQGIWTLSAKLVRNGGGWNPSDTAWLVEVDENGIASVLGWALVNEMITWPVNRFLEKDDVSVIGEPYPILDYPYDKYGPRSAWRKQFAVTVV